LLINGGDVDNDADDGGVLDGDDDSDDNGGGGDGGGDDDGDGGGDDDGEEGDGAASLDDLVALKKAIDDARSNELFEGPVAGPIQLCLKAKEGMDNELEGFAEVLDRKLLTSIVVSTYRDLQQMNSVRKAFFEARPHLNKYQIRTSVNRAYKTKYDTDDDNLEEVNVFADLADADEDKPEEVIVYNQVIQALTLAADEENLFNDVE